MAEAPNAHDRATRIAVRAAPGRLSADDAAALADLVARDPDAKVRAVALAALVRSAPRRISAPAWRLAAGDGDAAVRRRAAETAPALGRAVAAAPLVALLADTDAWVAEAAAHALGECPAPTARAVDALVAAATGHRDALVRESAVAALGALGVPETLPAVLAACDDKPAIRRRAVLALAAFEGPAVEARLLAALDDRDWQVRQAAEDLTGHRSEP
ncbi:MAG: HEAT repeat domain-containing protein [Actinomycetota bacterium]